MKFVTIQEINTDRFNPFHANEAELIVNALNDAGLLQETTIINDLPAQHFLDSFLTKRTMYRNATRLGAVLIESKKIHPDKLQEALAYQESHRDMKLGEIFVNLGLCSQEDVDTFLKIQKSKRANTLA